MLADDVGHSFRDEVAMSIQIRTLLCRVGFCDKADGNKAPLFLHNELSLMHKECLCAFESLNHTVHEAVDVIEG